MRLGLRPGDQVTAINGTPLDDRDRGEQILHTLASSSEARVTVIRGGQQQDLNLNIAQVAQEAEQPRQPGARRAAAAPAPPSPEQGAPSERRAATAAASNGPSVIWGEQVSEQAFVHLQGARSRC